MNRILCGLELFDPWSKFVTRNGRELYEDREGTKTWEHSLQVSDQQFLIDNFNGLVFGGEKMINREG